MLLHTGIVIAKQSGTRVIIASLKFFVNNNTVALEKSLFCTILMSYCYNYMILFVIFTIINQLNYLRYRAILAPPIPLVTLTRGICIGSHPYVLPELTVVYPNL